MDDGPSFVFRHHTQPYPPNPNLPPKPPTIPQTTSAGLATCILEAQLEKRKNFVMFTLFSVTCSLGVALGIALASVYDAESKEAALLEGCFNAFSAGGRGRCLTGGCMHTYGGGT